jgi:hypothetical protein
LVEQIKYEKSKREDLPKTGGILDQFLISLQEKSNPTKLLMYIF